MTQVHRSLGETFWYCTMTQVHRSLSETFWYCTMTQVHRLLDETFWYCTMTQVHRSLSETFWYCTMTQAHTPSHHSATPPRTAKPVTGSYPDTTTHRVSINCVYVFIFCKIFGTLSIVFWNTLQTLIYTDYRLLSTSYNVILLHLG